MLDIDEDKLKLYIRNIFHDIWKAKLDTSVKGETYKSFKDQMCFESFLVTLDRNSRRTLVKFRTSDHKLLIEEGRHKGIPRENRMCKFCGTEIEDEQHMLIDCKLYGERPKWFSDIGEKYPNFNTLTNHQKFLFLMSQEDNDLTMELAKKLSKWLNLREKIFSYFLDT